MASQILITIYLGKGLAPIQSAIESEKRVAF